MARHVVLRFILAPGLILLAWGQWACTPRLDEQQVRARLVEPLRLQNDQLHVRAIGRETQPIASIDYGGVPARVRFRYQQGAWVIDAVDQEGRWLSGEAALAALSRDVPAKARALQTAEMMPRYARTLKLLLAWSTLLTADCVSGLPASDRAVRDLHAAYHRTLFANRGGADVHNPDSFVRDAWWKMLHVRYSPTRVDVQSGGADGRLDTPDDMGLVYTRTPVRKDVNVCMPHFTMPAAVAEALGRDDAPAAWNLVDVMGALRKSGQLEMIGEK